MNSDFVAIVPDGVLHGDLAGVQVLAGRVVLSWAPGNDHQAPIRVAFRQATVAAPEMITGEDPPRFQL